MRIVESQFLTSAVKPEGYPESPWCDIAFAGRSNVGKSSFINALLGRKAVAKTSATPGKTRLLNFFLVRFLHPMESGEEQEGFLHFVDLPGYGFAKVSQGERESWRNMMQTYFNDRLPLRGVIVLVDIRLPADAKDRVMIDMLREANKPFMVCATKRDKIPSGKVYAACKALREGLGLTDEPVLAVSSPKRQGLAEAMRWIEAKILLNNP